MLNDAVRQRLDAAVGALLEDRALVRRPLTERLMAVVVLAKMPVGLSKLRLLTGEGGRWLGLSRSLVARQVLPGMRGAGSVVTEVVTEVGEDGRRRVTGLEWELLPLTAALEDPRHPLVLAKKDLALLLRLCERVFAPGWEPVDGPVTPPGLLGLRRGRGAAAERLALLRMVLRTRPDGRVRLVGGAVREGECRVDVTVSRLLGCSVAEASMVVEGLAAQELVVVDHDERSGKCRLVVPAVAAAYGRSTVLSLPDVSDEPESAEPGGRVVEGGCPACAQTAAEELVLEGDGWAQLSFDALDDASCASVGGALRDQDAAGALDVSTDRPSDLGEHRVDVDAPDVAGSAQLHASHAPLGDVGESGEVVLGFSGVADRGDCRRPERASAREDRGPMPRDAAKATCPAGGPLRGEQHPPLSLLPSPITGRLAIVASRPAAVPQDLVDVLEPVRLVWERIGRASARRRVRTLLARELRLLEGLVGPEYARQALGERLQRRLERQLGQPVTDPVGWFISRGLPQRPGCCSVLCDDGVRMDTGRQCPGCDVLIADRRALRVRVAAQVQAEFAGAERTWLRAEVERRLRHDVALRAERAARRREQAAADRAKVQAALAEQQRVREADRQQELSRPCADCGLPNAVGLCPVCSWRRMTQRVIGEIVDLTVAFTADLGDAAALAEASERCAQDIRRTLDEAATALRSQGLHEDMIVLETRFHAERLRDQRRQWALRTAGLGEAAQVEAQQAFDAMWRGRRRYASAALAQEAARAAAKEAGDRCARHLMEEKLYQLRELRGEVAPSRPATDWRQRLAEYAARPLPEDHRAPGGMATEPGAAA
ncbi:hypothetical protein ACH4PU_30945 [Streptomyces sp. NPDC021100]|uniref:hypothetical protein n=1 Tax=Streptomyces sp. NPDC021100 TaxID=3365114 RepID=UPI003796538F